VQEGKNLVIVGTKSNLAHSDANSASASCIFSPRRIAPWAEKNALGTRRVGYPPGEMYYFACVEIVLFSTPRISAVEMRKDFIEIK